ncbi:MAG: hypothetical protein IT383_18715 [Deltaproteobacteria bacterium]|nr:hypothetical protein [Deltaproteobacteria bacterium]
MPRCSLIALVLAHVTLAALAGCTLGGLLDPGGALDDEEAAMRAMRADVEPRTLVEEQLLACVMAAGAAAELAGAQDFITRGTVDVRGGAPSYDDQPADELVLREEGHDTRYRIDALAISQVDSLGVVLLHDHEIRARVIREDAFDLDLVSERNNDALERSAEGIFEEDDVTYELELDEEGSATSEIDGDLVRYQSNERTTSLVTADRLEVEIEEDEDYILIISEHAYENRTTVTTLEATVAGKRLSLDEGRVRRSFVDSAPTEPEFWAETEGALELDGAVVGELAFNDGSGGAYEIVLELEGDDEVLERWTP